MGRFRFVGASVASSTQSLDGESLSFPPKHGHSQPRIIGQFGDIVRTEATVASLDIASHLSANDT